MHDAGLVEVAGDLETGERIGFDMCFSAGGAGYVSLCTCEDGPTPPPLGVSAGTLGVQPPAVPSAA